MRFNLTFAVSFALALSSCIDFDARLGACVDAGLCPDDGSAGGGGGASGGAGGGAAGGTGGGTAGGASGGGGGDDAGLDASVPMSRLELTAPSGVSFTIQEGGTQTVRFSLANAGDLAATGLMLSVDNGPSFTLAAQTCGASLPPGLSCSVDVTFTSTTPGMLNATLTARADDSSASLGLRGVTNPLGYGFVVAPTSVDFGEAAVGTSSPPVTVTFVNTGTATLTAPTVQVTPAGAPFLTRNSTCAGAYPADAGCSFEVVFSPVAEGQAVGQVVVTTPTMTLPSQLVDVRGLGFGNVTLVVSTPGAAAGAGFVTGFDGGVACTASPSGACTLVARRGTAGTLLATPDAGHAFNGWGGLCAGRGPCALTLGADAGAVQAMFEPFNRAFVLPTLLRGAIDGGLANPSSVCVEAATAAGLPSPTSFIAYLAGTSTTASSRLAGSRGWVTPRGEPWADTPADLAAGRSWYALDRFPDGGRVVIAQAWVGTAATNCLGWTNDLDAGVTGGVVEPGASGTRFSTPAPAGCATDATLFCLELGHNSPLPALTVPVGARVAFLGRDLVTGVLPEAAANALCTADAQDAGLAGDFVAMRSSSTARGTSLVDLDAGTWYRPDGVKLYERAGDLALGAVSARPLATLTVNATGAHTLLSYDVWTGGYPYNLSTSSCGDWTDAGTVATVGRAVTIRSFGFVNAPKGCTLTSLLYCFQR